MTAPECRAQCQSMVQCPASLCRREPVKDDITGKPLVVSNKSTHVIRRALVSAHRAGDITDLEYRMTYAEVCEIGRDPQMFGGKPIDPAEADLWKRAKSWS